jgi:hypothetical protein
MFYSSFLKFSLPVFLLLVISTLPACDGTSDWGQSNPSSSGLNVEETQTPQLTYLENNGKTQVIVQFSVRDGAGIPLPEDQLDVQLNIDDQPLDVESLLNQSSFDLAVNLYFAMVLDASYSMTQHNPPAFTPMLTAARDSYQEVLDLWSTRPGEVKFSLLWFEEVMNQSQDNTNLARFWEPDDILSIPEPISGTATKLHSAVKVMSDHLQAEYDSGIFNGVRDQYVMLVFSDGADNYSWFDNSTIEDSSTTASGADYHQFGTVATTLAEATQAISGHPSLTAHVIGLGSAINTTELTQIAAAGNGTYQANPSSENIDQLFQSVLQQFTTILTRGAEVPLPPSDYKFTVSVKDKLNGATGSYSFMMHAGDLQAGVVPTP